MDKQDKKQAIDAYKKRESVAGIYALRSAATGGVWVGSARDIEAVENRIRFTLRAGSHMNKALQAAFNAHGETDIRLEELELLDKDQLVAGPERTLRERSVHWRTRLSAEVA